MVSRSRQGGLNRTAERSGRSQLNAGLLLAKAMTFLYIAGSKV
jgi:hypothetical protein